MKIIEIPKIELPNGKTHIAIDMFTKMLRDISIKDGVGIEIKKKINEHSLTIYAEAYGEVVDDSISIDSVVNDLFDIKRMERYANHVYELLKSYLVIGFEQIESFQSLGVDEKWEFLELWCM